MSLFRGCGIVACERFSFDPRVGPGPGPRQGRELLSHLHLPLFLQRPVPFVCVTGCS